MRERLDALLEKAETVVEDCSGLVDGALVAEALQTIAMARSRLSYPDNVTVVAVAGGTGSGKSSLVNALAGEEAVEVGGLRPTTSTPTAVVTSDVDETFTEYLTELGIDSTVVVPGEGLCLIDLPDFDSIDVGHRNQVAEILPKVDAVVFVTDPEKYRDASLHQLIKSSVIDGDWTFYVLNQADRLDAGALDLVSTDLLVALEEDGIGDPIVLVTSANPPSGPPVGVENVTTAVERLTRNHDVPPRTVAAAGHTVRKMRAHLGHEAPTLVADGVLVREEVSQRLLAGDNDGAALVLTTHLESLADELGDIPRARVLGLIRQIPEAIAQMATMIPSVEIARGRGSRASANLSPDVRTAIENKLATSILEPVGEIVTAVSEAREDLSAVDQSLVSVRRVDR